MSELTQSSPCSSIEWTRVALLVVSLSLLTQNVQQATAQTTSAPLRLALESWSVQNDPNDKNRYLFWFWVGRLQDSDAPCVVFTSKPKAVPQENNFSSGYQLKDAYPSGGYYYPSSTFRQLLTERSLRQSAADAWNTLLTVGEPGGAFKRLAFLIGHDGEGFKFQDNVYFFPRGDGWFYKRDEVEGVVATRNPIARGFSEDEPLLHFLSIEQLYSVLAPIGELQQIPVGQETSWTEGRQTIQLHHESTEKLAKLSATAPLLLRGEGRNDHILAWKTNEESPTQFLWLPKVPNELAFIGAEKITTEKVEQERLDSLVQRAYVPFPSKSERYSSSLISGSRKFNLPQLPLLAPSTTWAHMTDIQLAKSGVDNITTLKWVPRNYFQQELFSGAVLREQSVTSDNGLPIQETKELDVPGPTEIGFAFVKDDAGRLASLTNWDQSKHTVPEYDTGIIFPQLFSGESLSQQGNLPVVGNGFVFHLMRLNKSIAYIQSRELTVESFVRSQGLPEKGEEDWILKSLHGVQNNDIAVDDTATQVPGKIAIWKDVSSRWITDLVWKDDSDRRRWKDWIGRERVLGATLLKSIDTESQFGRYDPSRVLVELQLHGLRDYFAGRLFAQIDNAQWNVHGSDPLTTVEHTWSFTNINVSLLQNLEGKQLVSHAAFTNSRKHYEHSREQRRQRLGNSFADFHVDPSNQPVVFIAPVGPKAQLNWEIAPPLLGAPINNVARRIVAHNYSGTEPINAFLRLPTRNELSDAISNEEYEYEMCNWPDSDQTDITVHSSPLVSEWACDLDAEGMPHYYVVGLNRWSDLSCIQNDLREGIEIKCEGADTPDFVSPVISMRWVVEIESSPVQSGDNPKEVSLKKETSDLDEELKVYLRKLFEDGTEESVADQTVPTYQTVLASIHNKYGEHPYWKLQYLRYLLFGGYWGSRDGRVVPYEDLTDSQILDELRSLFP